MSLGQNDTLAEVFLNEEVYWLPAEGRTRYEARRIVADLEGERPTQYAVRVVRGTIGEQHGEPWFTVGPTGDRFYEIEWVGP